jgi:hypothetical protein
MDFILNGKKIKNKKIYIYIYLSPRMQQSVRGHLAAMLAGNDSDMPEIHPVMYLL